MIIMPYFTFILFTLITGISLSLPGPYSLMGLAFVFVGIPLLDFLIGENKENPNLEQIEKGKNLSLWAPPLYVYALTHFLILIYGAYQVYLDPQWEKIAMTAATVGLYTGGLGITVAHELCHKKELFPRLLADILLSTVCYQHFAIEHIKGHHFQVSTPDDPASARMNENVYRFLVRTIWGSFIHALKIDRKEVFKGMGMSFLFMNLSLYFSREILIFFLLQSLTAIILLELVNYVEHYGLSRKQLANGKYEKVLPLHSWNSSHLFSNYLLFNLQRHSDHHALASIPYLNLKHHETAPQLPSGYPGMILISLVPPLWFRIMNKKLITFHRVN
jgi:alkane 1-monooxygenase